MIIADELVKRLEDYAISLERSRRNHECVMCWNPVPPGRRWKPRYHFNHTGELVCIYCQESVERGFWRTVREREEKLADELAEKLAPTDEHLERVAEKYGPPVDWFNQGEDETNAGI